jgi:hypothetical protein
MFRAMPRTCEQLLALLQSFRAAVDAERQAGDAFHLQRGNSELAERWLCAMDRTNEASRRFRLGAERHAPPAAR